MKTFIKQKLSKDTIQYTTISLRQRGKKIRLKNNNNYNQGGSHSKTRWLHWEELQSDQGRCSSEDIFPTSQGCVCRTYISVKR